MEKMRQAADEINRRTSGRVTFRFYPGGIMGNDASVMRKINVNQLQGGIIPGGGLRDIYPDSQVYSLPLIFRSYDEVDYVRSRMDDQLILRVVFFQARDNVAIDLYYMQLIKPLQQRASQRTQARADFHHDVRGFRADDAYNVGNDLLIHQEVLTKPFTCFMHGSTRKILFLLSRE